MSQRLSNAFAEGAKQKRPVFVAYLMAGYQTREATAPTMLALQQGGADVIELGIPFTDPIADGPTIQVANQKALDNKVNMKDCLAFVREARASGVTIPIVFMGYYNPILNYGEQNFVRDASAVGADGFIVVDLPPEEAETFRDHAKKYSMSYVPLVCPTTSDQRIKKLTSLADSFVYCVSINGITGERTELPENLPIFINRVRQLTSLPLAIGFGISTRRHFEAAGKLADGVVIGSAIIKVIGNATTENPGHDQAARAREYAELVTGRAAAK
jgi:tryptophan synthase